jgi:capsid protein
MYSTEIVSMNTGSLQAPPLVAARRERVDGSVKTAEMWRQRYADLRASYDAARTSTEYQNIWANADRYDADSANSREVRHTLISRSRYEIHNNGYSDGIAQTVATDLVGIGPQLRMQTSSEGLNRLIENTWWLWTKAIQFRRKLWCLAHAKHSDGEGMAVVRRNPRVKHDIKYDLMLHEADQFQSPYMTFGQRNYIDGIRFDEFGNPMFYDLLRDHPGAVNRDSISMEVEQVPAEFVLHWFKLRRPGQHRGVPECSSTLNVGAAARRWRESTLAAADTAADFTLFIKTQMTPEDAASVTPMSTLDINKRMMTALPEGYDPFQLKAEYPTANHAEFSKSLINEQARPKSMPYNKAACDSSSYNYASGRLDHQTYYAALDVEREDCNDLVLDPLFDLWFDAAVRRFGWLGGNPEVLGTGLRVHVWDWPKHRVADVESEANANQTRLQSGQLFHPQLFSDAGLDFEDELDKAATAYGITVDDLRKRILDVTLPVEQQPAAMPAATPPTDQAMEAMFRNMIRRQSLLNGHANGDHSHG